ncbi:MAG: ferrous iron transport protein B, partial [Planctomycetia bacterium]|nr:ferrous iron transport protein B [Planctomycetia bacterium]
ARQTIGNFPGVTVERYEGYTQYGSNRIALIDLPGIYGFSAVSEEEKVTAEYLLGESYDVIVNIIDASLLERNLYLTLILKEMGRPMIVALNMVDTARQRGMEIDSQALSKALGVPVVETVGNRGTGMNDLLAEIVRVAETQQGACSAMLPITQGVVSHDSANAVPGARDSFQTEPVKCFACSREDLENTRRAIPAELDHASVADCSGCRCCGMCPSGLGRQTLVDMARYREITQIGTRCVRNRIPLERNMSDRIDFILTNKYLGTVIFLLAMYLVFQLTFTLGQYPMEWIERLFNALSTSIGSIWPEGQYEFFKSLLCNGIIGGVGGVLVFLPNILLLFLAISILEDSGYMARAAFLSDRWLHRIGLHGRSIVPMLVGFGCTVPALMASKMSGSRKERLVTMFVLPLFSCGARFPIYAMLIPACFSVAWRGPVLWLIYLIGIVLAIVIAKAMSCMFQKDNDPVFVIELPPYHVPTFRTVGIRTLERCWLYVKKAGTVILGISVILWLLTTCPGLPQKTKDEFDQHRDQLSRTITDTEQLNVKLSELARDEAQQQLVCSYAGRIGHVMEPLLKPMGFDWKIGTALVGAVAAKEVFVAQLGIVYSVNDENENEGQTSGLSDVLARHYSPLTCFCIMLFCLIATPCMATFIVMARETGSWRWAVAQWLFLTLLAWCLTTLVYQIGNNFV